MKRTFLVATIMPLLLTGCGSLPSVAEVERKFRSEHPTYTVENVSYHIEGSRDGHIKDDAIFRVTYRRPGDSRSHVYQREFGTVAEGWIEVPAKKTEE